MKKLIALAAVLGLAVSSWGLTPQNASNVTATPALGVEVAEAQMASYYGPMLWRRWNPLQHLNEDTMPHYQAALEGAAAAFGGLIGGAIGSPFGPAATWLGIVLGAAAGSY